MQLRSCTNISIIPKRGGVFFNPPTYAPSFSFQKSMAIIDKLIHTCIDPSHEFFYFFPVYWNWQLLWISSCFSAFAASTFVAALRKLVSRKLDFQEFSILNLQIGLLLILVITNTPTTWATGGAKAKWNERFVLI